MFEGNLMAVDVLPLPSRRRRLTTGLRGAASSNLLVDMVPVSDR